MDEHTHATLYRALVNRLSATTKAHSGLTAAEFTQVFEDQGILTQAMELPEVRQALTVVLLQAMYRDDTGELYLDLDEESLLRDEH
jgi:hypothetical protein